MINTDAVRIKEINIKYFRSITNMTIEVDKFNMFVGLNDVGKSNVLKALNLFFKGETDYEERLIFEKDFSQLFPEKSKKAKEIAIKITFDVPNKYKGYGEYIWEKSWRSNGRIHKDIILTGDGSEVSPRSKIPNLLRKIEYRYVPAVKSREYYRTLLVQLYKSVSSSVDSPLRRASNGFSKTLKEYTASMSELILSCIGMESELSLPQNFSDIFETLVIQTSKKNSKIKVPLTLRGDGIQVRHIPIILKYIADEDYKQSSARGAVKINTIWGFEEPENGLELIKSFELANEFLQYANEIQIFLTTHSPAFYSKRNNEGVKVFYINKNADKEGTIVDSNPKKQFMDENLGLMPLVAPYISQIEKEINIVKKTWEESPLIDKPTIMVEGKSDKNYLTMAIKELSPDLLELIENNELRIVTEDDGAGTTLIKNWAMAWLHSGNKSKLMVIFDKDNAGVEAANELKGNQLYNQQNGKTRVKVINLFPSKDIIDLYNNEFVLPYEIEHLLCYDIWKIAIEKKYCEPRSAHELINGYQNTFNVTDSIDALMEMKLNEQLRNTIASYNPHRDKKGAFYSMVEKCYKEKSCENIFSGFQKTIDEIESYFI